jgi:hypothetical protein
MRGQRQKRDRRIKWILDDNGFTLQRGQRVLAKIFSELFRQNFKPVALVDEKFGV